MTTTRTSRTSITHPLRIDEVQVGAGLGTIGITFCPGKCGDSARGFRWERDLSADLDVIVRWGARDLVTLIEDHEFEMLGVPPLGDEARARGLKWHHLPIVDIEPPDQRFRLAWVNVGTELTATLQAGGKVVVHCRGGLGRAGTVAAQLLVETGLSPRRAVDLVRTARPNAIETIEQEQYILNLSAARLDRRDGVR